MPELPFFKKKEGVLGIDVGTSSVKMVELSRNGVNPRLRNYSLLSSYGYAERFNNAIQTSSFKMLEDDVIDMVRAVLVEAKTKTRTAAFSIPAFLSFFTVVDFPKMDREEVEKAIPYEARKYIPVPVSEVVLRSYIVPSSSDRSTASVLLVAVPRETIEKYKRIAKGTGLELISLEVEILSLVRALQDSQKGIVLLIDIGARSTSISIVDSGFVRITHHFDAAGDDLTKAIVRGMNLIPSKAESLKRSTGIVGREREETVSSIIFPILDMICLETVRILDIYKERQPQKKIERCILVGGSANLPGIVDYFVEKFAVTVSVGNPFTDILYPEVLSSALREISPLCAIAAGLAKRTLR